MESEDMNSNNKKWYKKRKDYWKSKDASLNSVLGGFEESHLPDVKCSNELLNGLILSKQLKPGIVIDCGAGIGRVTEYVLSNFFEEIDLLEKDEKYIEKCKLKFYDNKKVKDIYMSSLESFKFKKKYDLIWVQWCLENIEDEDLDFFLNECYTHLNDEGLIIVKENLFNNDEDEIEEEEEDDKKKKDNDLEYQYSDLDYSKQRPDAFYINLFIKNKFKIKLHFLNPNWPKEMMPLCVYVLSKK